MINDCIKHSYLVLFLVINSFIYSQSKIPFLISENQEDFIQNFSNYKIGKEILLQVSNEKTLSLTVTVQKIAANELTLIGTVDNNQSSTFNFFKKNGILEGSIVFRDTNVAYQLTTKSNGKVYISEIDIHKILCIDFEATPVTQNTDKGVLFSKATPSLQSLPGATAVVYLDFDGETVSNTAWLNGSTIDAQSANFSDETITEVWKIMAEDFRPFTINVTTDRSVFEAAQKTNRIMCIFTTTKDAAPDAGGVAYINSFSWNDDTPCWVYNLWSIRQAGETGSHEVGHTLGLGHDGRPGEEYYDGHGQWSPIMGWSVNKPLGHWSLGEYDNASNTQDDIAIIASNNNTGFKNDDHGNSIAEATPILVDNNGNVSASQNFGIISERTDMDLFSFVIETGNVTFNLEPNPDYPNLNIQARILNAIGEEVAISNPLTDLNASFNTQLTEGTYYLEIDGVGEGNDFSSGYSDYSSLGNYSISGNYTPGDNNQPPVSDFQASIDCSVINFSNTSVNTIDSYLWDFGDGNTSTEENPVHNYESSGVYTVSLTTTNTAGQHTNQKDNFIVINLPSQPTPTDQHLCSGESVTITMSGSSAYQWYDAPTGGNLITSENSYETGALTTTQTFYVAGVFGDCITDTRTVVRAIIDDNPEQPVITIANDKNLSVNSGFNHYQWYHNNEPIEDANQATYVPNITGEYSVEVFNETGCANISEGFSLNLTQLNQIKGAQVFKFYPNPVIDKLNIEGLTTNETNISIVNIYGQTVMKSFSKPEIGVSQLPNGLYMLFVNNRSIGKFVKL